MGISLCKYEHLRKSNCAHFWSPSEQLRMANDEQPPALRRATSSTSTAPSSATLDSAFSFGVCDRLDDVYDLGRLAQCSASLRREVWVVLKNTC